MSFYKKIKNILDKRESRYLVIGGLNTFFGYFCGIFLYYFFIKKIEVIFILIMTNIFSITFSFFTYKLFVFKTLGNWLKEYVKCYMVYGSASIISITLTWFFLDIIGINIWFSQAISVMLVVLFSYYGHSKFTFKMNNE
jgi:putative flippase GtrA